MSIKSDVRKKSIQMLSDPRVLKLMQNPQFMKVMAALIQVPGRVNSFTNDQADRLATSLKLATRAEVRELRKTVERLEKDIDRLKQQPR